LRNPLIWQNVKLSVHHIVRWKTYKKMDKKSAAKDDVK
jgi:hypothetical protein